VILFSKYFPELASTDPEVEKVVRDQFHLLDKDGRPTGVFDFQIFEFIKNQKPMFVLGGIPHIYDGKSYRQDRNGAELKTMIRSLIYPQFVKSSTLKRTYDLFLSDAELQKTPPELNAYPAHWIAFQNGFYDVSDGSIHPHDPKYMLTNIIPHEYDPKAKPHGEHIEEWFDYIMPDKQDREMFLQYAGYSLTRDMRQQKFLMLCGNGGTGKSTLLRLLETVVGKENTASVPLDGLTQRFYSFELMGKLLNSCADISIENLTDTSQIKKLLGEDVTMAEAKGKDPVFFRNYAKMVFSTNELPMIQGERTTGFYRRLLVLTLDKKPKQVNPDLFSTLEIDYFIHLCMDALARLHRTGMIQESEHSRKAVEQLRNDSDSVQAFLSDKLEPVAGERIKRGELYEMYEQFCFVNDRTPLKKTAFFKALRSKGLQELKTFGEYYFTNLSKKTPFSEIPFDTE
jgi:P4 family phage/plasmid primase-like protien